MNNETSIYSLFHISKQIRNRLIRDSISIELLKITFWFNCCTFNLSPRLSLSLFLSILSVCLFHFSFLIPSCEMDYTFCYDTGIFKTKLLKMNLLNYPHSFISNSALLNWMKMLKTHIIMRIGMGRFVQLMCVKIKTKAAIQLKMLVSVCVIKNHRA